MKTSLPLLVPLNITIATPCHASWDKMKGDEQVRHCEQCHQNVYNLSEMSAAEAVDLIREKEGHLCVRLYRRADGTMITSDCPVGLQWRIWKWLRKRRAWVAALFAILFLPACGMGMPRQPELPNSLPLAPVDQAKPQDSTPNEQNKDEKRNPGL
jgi:hypothetical protein